MTRLFLKILQLGSVTRSRVSAFALAAMLPLALAGCLGTGSAPLTFDLSSPRNIRQGNASKGVLVVNEPIATLPVDSDRIVVRTAPSAVAYLTGAQWVDRLTRLVQTRLIETFENAHVLKNVGRPGLLADHTLSLEIRRFELDVTRNEAYVEIFAKVTAERSARSVSTQVFVASAPASATTGPAVAQALDVALAQAMTKIVSWTASRI